MKVSKNLHWYFPLLLIFLLCACKQDKKELLSSGDRITLMAANGKYVGVDWYSGKDLIADRKTPSDRDQFVINFEDQRTLTLQCKDMSFVGSHSAEDSVLHSAHFDEGPKRELAFEMEKDTVLFLKNKAGKYLRVTPNGRIKLDQDERNAAGALLIRKIPERPFTHFTRAQVTALIFFALLMIASMVFFQTARKETMALGLLLLAGLFIRIFMALLDPYLSLWDEQFHALVAKNMMDHPFKPMLNRDMIGTYEMYSWSEGHIWLHKQPLFLWQMAASMKLFGVNVFALRLPSILLSTGMIWLIYRIGSLSVNKRAAFYGAFLFAASNFTLELVSGSIGMEHNDIAFSFYVAASIWAWLEYRNADGRRKILFLMLIGIFCGCAVMVKWLVGLLVYLGWGLSILFLKEDRRVMQNYLHLLLALGITVVVFLPWQLYILNTFPELSRHEYSMNTLHFTDVIEGHGGTGMYHLDKALHLFGVPWQILLLAVGVLFLYINRWEHRLVVVGSLLAVFLFFTLAQTKILAYTYCIASLAFLAMGVLLDGLFRFLVIAPEFASRKWIAPIYHSLILLAIGIWFFDVEGIQKRHTAWLAEDGDHRTTRLETVKIMKKMNEELPDIEHAVILNCRKKEAVPMMFFTDCKAAYKHIPENYVLDEYATAGYHFVVMDKRDLPDHLKDRSDVTLVEGYWEIFKPKR